MPNQTITPLASSQINHDHLTVELVEPDGMPAMVRIVWPPQPTVVDPKRFPDIAATIARLFAEAAARLASIKAGSGCELASPHEAGHLRVRRVRESR